MKNIVILGAGPCGLSAAWELSNSGYNVTVIEKESQVGGLCRTVEYKGFRFDLGGHRFISSNPGLIKKISDLMEDELLCVERRSAIRLKGKTFRYPLSAKEILTKINPAIAIKSVIDYLFISIFQKFKNQPELTFEDWALNRFGRTLYEIFFETYTRKFWGVPPKELSSDWAIQRIPVLKFNDIIKELIGTKTRRHEAYAKRFYYPKKGIGQIFDYMAEAVIKNRGLIYCNTKATDISIENHAIKGVTILKGSRKQNIDCDYLVSTIPLPELCSMIKPNPNGVTTSESGLNFRSVRFMNILINKPKISNNTWIYVPENKYLMTRIQEPKLSSPFNAPPDKTSLILEIPCNFGDDIWNADDKDILNRSINNLSSLGIDIKAKVSGYFSTYVEHGYPVYRLGYEKHCCQLLHDLSQYKNLISAGRQGLFRYIFMDQAMEMGIVEARNIIEDRMDRVPLVSIGLERELIEAKAVNS